MTIINYDQRLVKSKNPYPKGPNDWKRFFSFNTDAKVIGIQYIVTALFFLLPVSYTHLTLPTKG